MFGGWQLIKKQVADNEDIAKNISLFDLLRNMLWVS